MINNEADRLADDFETWWQAEGQFSRAGGGDYEKTFAFNAWRAALAKQQAPEATAEPAAVPRLPEPVAWRGLTQSYPQDNDWRYGPWVYDFDPAKYRRLFTEEQMRAYALAAQGTQKAEQQASPQAQDRVISLNLAQATHLLALFGGEDAEIVLQDGDGHAGNGLYAHFLEHPEEGSVLLNFLAATPSTPQAAPTTQAEPMSMERMNEIIAHQFGHDAIGACNAQTALRAILAEAGIKEKT